MIEHRPSALFERFSVRGVEFRNRIAVSPMCQYSAVDGLVGDYHLVHIGRFAMGGFGLVMVEATSICPEGRLTYGDLGLWRDDQVAPLRRIANFVHAQGARLGIQLGHAGPKAATLPPWADEADRPEDGRWEIHSVSDEPYAPGWQRPVALTGAQLGEQVVRWRDAARRAAEVGADVLELHMAHGYLLHAFLSPISNNRADEFGGDPDRRMRFPLWVTEAVREAWPADRPLFVRVAVVDNDDKGIDLEQTVAFAVRLKALGVDVIDCSSGGFGGAYSHPIRPGYQVDWAAEVRRRADIPTVAVGLIMDPGMADDIVRSGKADFVALGRQALVDPAWPVRACEQLGQFTGEERFDVLPLQSRSWIAKRSRQLARQASATTPRGVDA